MFLERLLLLCQKNNTDISSVLRSLGLSTSKGTAWRKGSVPNGEILLMLAAHFHVSTDYLLGNTDDPRPVGSLSGDDQQKKPAPPSGSELSDLDYIKSRLPHMSREDLAKLMAELPKIFMEK